MQYNFEVRSNMTDEETQTLIGDVAEGLEVSSQLIIEAKIRVNTELPEDKIQSLTDAVSRIISKKLGVESEAQLTSKEY